jgi:hypothetical protein
VWIPPAEHWNHNFLGVGNGGYMGAIDYRYMARALNRGFATASTDTGHTGEDLSFAAGHPEKIVDWGYRSIHVMTESAKLIVFTRAVFRDIRTLKAAPAAGNRRCPNRNGFLQITMECLPEIPATTGYT